MFFTISFLKLGPMLSPGPFHLTSLFTFFIVPGILPRTLLVILLLSYSFNHLFTFETGSQSVDHTILELAISVP